MRKNKLVKVLSIVATALFVAVLMSIFSIGVFAESTVQDPTIVACSIVVPAVVIVFIIFLMILYYLDKRKRIVHDIENENNQIAQDINYQEDVKNDESVVIIENESTVVQEEGEKIVLVDEVVEENNEEEAEETVMPLGYTESDELSDESDVLDDEILEEEQIEEDDEEELSDVALLDLAIDTTKLSKESVRRPFLNKMSMQGIEIKEFYNELKNYLLSFKDVKSRATYACEQFKYHGDVIAKMSLTGRVFKLHLGLNTELYNYKKFYQFDLSDRKAYAEVPFTVKIKSQRGLNNAKLLIDDVMLAINNSPKRRYETSNFVENFGAFDNSYLKRMNMADRILNSSAANTVDEYMSDEEALKILQDNQIDVKLNLDQKFVNVVSVYVNEIEPFFNSIETCNITSLKKKGLVALDADAVKILARGELTKPLDVRVQEFSPSAVKMIILAGGNIQKVNLV